MGIFSKIHQKLKDSLNTNVDYISDKLKKLMSERNIDEIRLLPSLYDNDNLCFGYCENLRYREGYDIYRFTRFALLGKEVFFKNQKIVLDDIYEESDDWQPLALIKDKLNTGEIDPTTLQLYDICRWIEKNEEKWSTLPDYISKKVLAHRERVARIKQAIADSENETKRLEEELKSLRTDLRLYNTSELQKELAGLNEGCEKALAQIKKLTVQIEEANSLSTQLKEYENEKKRLSDEIFHLKYSALPKAKYSTEDREDDFKNNVNRRILESAYEVNNLFVQLEEPFLSNEIVNKIQGLIYEPR